MMLSFVDLKLQTSNGKWYWQGNNFEEELNSGHWSGTPSPADACAGMSMLNGVLKIQSMSCSSTKGVNCLLRFP